VNKETLIYRVKLAALWLTGPVVIPVVLFWDFIKQVPGVFREVYQWRAALAAFKNGGPVPVENSAEVEAFFVVLQAKFAGVNDDEPSPFSEEQPK